jgi:hypothetical protein
MYFNDYKGVTYKKNITDIMNIVVVNNTHVFILAYMSHRDVPRKDTNQEYK